MKIINIIEELCSGCRLCQLLCSFINTREFNPSKSRIKIVKNDNQAIMSEKGHQCLPGSSAADSVAVNFTWR